MDQSIRAMADEITRLADEQQRTTAAVAHTPEDLFRREIGELSRGLQRAESIPALLEVAQTIEATMSSQTEALREFANTRDRNQALATAQPPLVRFDGDWNV